MRQDTYGYCLCSKVPAPALLEERPKNWGLLRATMQSKAATISEYLEELPPDRRSALTELRALIHRVAPETAEEMQYGLPAFGDLCAMASQKNYMSLYVCESDVVKAHLEQLGKVTCGKGCIRFKRLDDLNLSAVESILREILELRKQGIGPSCGR